MKAELVPANGDPPIPIMRDLTVVGRREYCDVQIDFHGLSKRHCVLVKTDGLLVIRDLATTNGTKVNGQRIRWAALLPNDRVTIGGYKVHVYLGPDETPSPSEQASQAVSIPPHPRLAGPVPAGGAASIPAGPSGRNGQRKEGARDGFAAPSPLVVPLVTREDVNDIEWVPTAGLFDDDDEAPASPSPVAGAADDDGVIELD
jgi:predicted component of type VI protein secretion system